MLFYAFLLCYDASSVAELNSWAGNGAMIHESLLPTLLRSATHGARMRAEWTARIDASHTEKNRMFT